MAVYAALIVGEARKEHPLVPVRKLATSLAMVGTIATVVGSAAFSALTQCFSAHAAAHRRSSTRAAPASRSGPSS